jgi:hypothetical protein
VTAHSTARQFDRAAAAYERALPASEPPHLVDEADELQDELMRLPLFRADAMGFGDLEALTAMDAANSPEALWLAREVLLARYAEHCVTEGMNRQPWCDRGTWAARCAVLRGVIAKYRRAA